MQIMFVFFLLFILFFLPWGGSFAKDPKHFSVIDSIGRSRLYDTQKRDSSFESKPFYFSKDGKRLFYIVGYGDIETKTYHFELRMYDTSAILSYIQGREKNLPTSKVIARFAHDQSVQRLGRWNSGGIRYLRQYDNETRLSFLAPDKNDIFQVYSISLSDFQLTQLTASDRHVDNYIIDGARSYILYTTEYRRPAGHCNELSFTVEKKWFADTLCLPDGLSYADKVYQVSPRGSYCNVYMTDMAGDRGQRLLAEAVPLAGSLDNAAISPNGDLLLMRVALREPASGLEKYEKEIALDNSEWDRLAEQWHDDNVMDRWPRFHYYAIIKLSKRSFNILSGAPIIDNGSAESSYWIDDDSVMLGGVTSIDAITRRNRDIESESLRSLTATYRITKKQYDFSVEPIVTPSFIKLPANIGENEKSGKLEFGDNIVERCGETVDGISQIRDSADACFSEHKDIGLKIIKIENYRTPAKIIAKDSKTGRSKIIFDFANDYAGKRLGETRLFRWIDANGGQWIGGLVLPVDYQPGQRYPLVVQMHGFDPNSFLVDGPHYGTAPYAAQSLANKNIAVLQMPGVKGRALHEVHPMLARGVNSAVKQLKKEGLVDINRVGLLGYSSTGSFVFKMLAFPEFKPAAALIADAYSPSPFGYTSFYGLESPGMVTHEVTMCGAKPWGGTQSEWIRRNPFYHLDRIDTPLLLEEFQTSGSGWWDVYVGLRRLGKPVEFRIFAHGKHPVLRPDIVVESQQLTVDWFDYWLNKKINNKNSADWGKLGDLMRKHAEAASYYGKIEALSDMDCTNKKM